LSENLAGSVGRRKSPQPFIIVRVMALKSFEKKEKKEKKEERKEILTLIGI